MHMSFEKIAPPAPKEEHPAYRAARMIKELHEENIRVIDGGQLFMQNGVDVTDEMRKQSAAQIVLCDQIMNRAAGMDPKHWEPAAVILNELKNEVEKPNAELDCSIPEIGNYGHDA